MPAITTPFDRELNVDHAFLARHCSWLVDAGATAIVPLGSLGEGATLSPDEKLAVLKTCLRAVGDRVPVVPGISGLSTREAVEFARGAEASGCRGLMVLPPYVYATDGRELKAHMAAVLLATKLPCMLYNNPVAYGIDFLPEQVAQLAQAHDNLQAVKESSADVRRITAIRALCSDRLTIAVGVDDLIVEGVAAGASGWVAGLVNALPAESVTLFDHARKGRAQDARALYEWFLPLLRFDTGTKFVQLIKLVQEQVGMGTARVRPPRLELEGEELDRARRVIEQALRTRPKL